MSVFYVLPPRPCIAERLAEFAHALFPGLPLPPDAGQELLDALTAAVSHQQGVIVVFREDLPDGADVPRALADGFGAEPGDEVVEVRPGVRAGEWLTRRRPPGRAA